MLEKTLTYSGAKSQQRTDTENRALPYSSWHRTINKSCYMLDVDSIEWRFINGKLTATAVIEVTRADNDIVVSDNYLRSILQRYNGRDLQGLASREVAAKLQVKAYIVLFREDCTEFWIYNLTDDKGWTHCNADRYARFLCSLEERYSKNILRSSE